MASEVEEFLMPTLEEEGFDHMLFQQDGAPLHFHKKITDFSKRPVSRETDWQGQAYRLATSFA
jgi:hypothetical protein